MITIKHVKCGNFRCLKEFDADFGDRTLITGANKVGKTTVRNAIFWILTGKLADGSAADNIRPHDNAGKDIDNIEIMVELTLDVDGREVVLKKTEKQKWTKHRGSSAATYEGNVTEYEINSIPKKQKDYQAFIESLVDAETLLYGTNAQAFLNLDTKKRRAKLMKLASGTTLADVARSDEKYEPILDILQDGTIDELIARSRKVISAKNTELEQVPIRIDELSKRITEGDSAELELERNRLKEEIEKAEQAVKNGDNSAAIEELKSRRMKLMFEINELKRQASEKSMQKRHDLNREVAQYEMQCDDLQREIDTLNREIQAMEKTIKVNTDEIETMKPKYAEAKARTFDESAWVMTDEMTICSLCGQRFPEDRIAKIKEEIEAKKAQALKDFTTKRDREIEEIKTRGNGLAQENTRLKKEIAEKQALISNKTVEIQGIREKIAKVKSELALIPKDTDADLVNDPKYMAMVNEVAEIDSKIDSLMNDNGTLSKLQNHVDELKAHLEDVNSRLVLFGENAKIEDRIAELTAEQRQLAQDIADEERIRDLLESLNKRYIEATTEAVNRHFRTIKWVMFRQNITNNGYESVCEPTVDGTSYYRGLNHGAKLLAEIEICEAFQNMSGVRMFLTADDCESIDEDRIPDVDRQLIIFRRTDERDLSVECV